MWMLGTVLRGSLRSLHSVDFSETNLTIWDLKKEQQKEWGGDEKAKTLGWKGGFSDLI